MQSGPSPLVALVLLVPPAVRISGGAQSVLGVVRAHVLAFLRSVGRRVCGIPLGPGFHHNRGGDPAVVVGLVAPYG